MQGRRSAAGLAFWFEPGVSMLETLILSVWGARAAEAHRLLEIKALEEKAPTCCSERNGMEKPSPALKNPKWRTLCALTSIKGRIKKHQDCNLEYLYLLSRGGSRRVHILTQIIFW